MSNHAPENQLKNRMSEQDYLFFLFFDIFFIISIYYFISQEPIVLLQSVHFHLIDFLFSFDRLSDVIQRFSCFFRG